MNAAVTRTLINGQFATSIDADNRGLAYGDGLFETVLVRAGKALWLDAHLRRLAQGAQRLQLACDIAQISTDCSRLLAASDAEEAVLKIILNRGSVGRGYTPPRAASVRIVSLAAAGRSTKPQWQDGVALGLCQIRLAQQPKLAGIKHLNRLEQVLAAGEMQRRGFVDGLLFDQANNLIETSRSNVFLVESGRVYTPNLNGSGVDGIMRQLIITACERLNVQVTVLPLGMSALWAADEVFICNSLIGIWPVIKIECMHKAIGPVCRQLQQEFEPHFYA